MLTRIKSLAIILVSILLGLYVIICLLNIFMDIETSEVDKWLDENELGEYKDVFRELGIVTLDGCGSPDQLERLPALPAADERRLRRAAQLLQQRLVLRQWLLEHRLHHAYSRLLSLDVSSLEDVYWLEDSAARHAVGAREFAAWSAARRGLPTGKEALHALKATLWSTVVKNSRHQDAWTWGGMLVVSVSVAGLVTLAAMTQPSLAPEAKHSLLQYVTGKYLHAPNCKVEWGWTEPQAVGGTMCFTVRFFQRNGQPYPICDTDQLCITVSHGARKESFPSLQISTVCELGSSTDPNSANTARVKFTVRTSGVYVISIMIGNAPICGSPFRKSFSPGAVDARRTAVLRHAATLVCAVQRAQPVHVQPRDAFNNACAVPPAEGCAGETEYPVEGYEVRISPLGCPVDEELSQSVTFQFDTVNQRVTMTVCFQTPGIYHAIITYKSVTLHNGEFDCIVLTASDTAIVQRNVSSKSHNICYEARLLSALNVGADKPIKPRKIMCYISPKQLTLKEMILRFIPKRLATFRLCPSTKLIFCSGSGVQTSPSISGGVFLVDDGIQPPVELCSPERDIIAATFTQFLLKNIGGSETFKDKQDFFYCEVRKVHNKHPHEKLSLKFTRENLVQSSLKATKNFSVTDWCRNFDISFQGEQGVDWGGVRREWFSLLCSRLFDSQYGLFTSFNDSPTGLVHPNPNRPPHLKLKYFELAGKIVGKCLYESALGGSYRQLVRARFTRSFLAQIIGLRVHYKYFEQDDPELYLSKIKYILDTDLDGADCPATELYFAEDIYDSSGKLVSSVDLIPNGAHIRVCNSSKHRYLDALAQYKLASRCKEEVDSFLRGLNLLIPDNLLSIFDENELELLVCGTGEVSVADWRAHALVNGGGRDFERVLSWFWAAITNFSTEERARLLQFTTGCSQLPPGGFQELTPRFQLTAAPTFGALPTAHTCFNQLCLPDYDSYEQLVNALLWAVNEGSEGFGLI